MTSRTSGSAAPRTLAWLAALLMLCVIVEAGEDPRAERGFSPETAFQMGEIDTVNLFNGNLVLTLPIGQTYTLDGGMGYGLNLVYNSSLWDADTVPNPYYDEEESCTHNQGNCDPAELTYPRPNLFSNAGFGWFVSLGELHPPAEGDFGPPANLYHIVTSMDVIGDVPEAPSVEIRVESEETLCLDPNQACVVSRPEAFIATLTVIGARDYFKNENGGWEGECLDHVVSGGPDSLVLVVDVGDGDPDRMVHCTARFSGSGTGNNYLLSVGVGPDTEWGRIETLGNDDLPDGKIRCGAGGWDECSEEYYETNLIRLSSAWTDGYRLVNWGACSLDSAYGQPKELPEFTLSDHLTCDTLFAQCRAESDDGGGSDDGGEPNPTVGVSCAEEHLLEVEATGSGTGTVQTLLPVGLENIVLDKDTSDPETGSHPYTWASRIELVAEPDADSTFEGWTFLPGGGDPTQPRVRCTVPDPSAPREALARMLHDAGCRATFEAVPANYGIVRVLRIGTGSGTVHDNGEGEIQCGSDCEGSYPAGTILLTAVADSEYSVFHRWTGDGCTPLTGDKHSAEVDVDVNTPRTCTAEFLAVAPSEYTLSVETSSSGSEIGHVESFPGAIHCSTVSHPSDICEDEFTSGDSVRLTAVGDDFWRWEPEPDGDCGAYLYNPEAWVFMDRHKTCTAEFVDCTVGPCDLKQLTIEFIGDGAPDGGVTLGSGGTSYECDGPDPCGHAFNPIQWIDLAVVEGAFQSWIGDACLELVGNATDPTPPPFQLTDHTVCKAVFGTPLELWELTARKIEDGDGHVWSVVAGQQQPAIDCDVGCPQDSGEFVELSTVQLVAEADGDSEFLGWSGACDSAGRVTMNEDDLECVAEFAPLYELRVTPKANGRVEGPEGINCYLGSPDCSGAFRKDSSVLLQALPYPDYRILGWGGEACEGAGAATSVSVPVTTDPTICWADFEFCPPGACGDTVRLTITDATHGTVSGDGNLHCGEEGNDCHADFSVPTSVSLVAEASEGYAFNGWTGCPVLDPGHYSTSILLNAVEGDQTCTAHFIEGEEEEYWLTVLFAGDGTGRVENLDGDLDCESSDPNCQELIHEGDRVRLKPTPDSGNWFSGWSSCPGTTEAGDIRWFDILEDTTCTATFEPALTYQVNIVLGGEGEIHVGVPPGGPWTVVYETDTVTGFAPGGTVEVRAEDRNVNNEVYNFVRWLDNNGEDCTGTNALQTFQNLADDVTCRALYMQAPEPFVADQPWAEPHRVNRVPLWMYLSPDGAKHTFYEEFEVGSGDPDNVFYTHDNTFLRLTTDNASAPDATSARLDMPDGERHFFSKHDDGTWKLDRMENAYGTGLTITYPTLQWRLEDDAGRIHTVEFEDPVSGGYLEELGPQISRITLEAFGEQFAEYNFDYAVPNLPWCYRNRLAIGGFPTPGDSPFPLLSSIRMPEEVTYTATDYADDFSGTSDCSDNGVPGALHGLELPTGGTLEWDYGSWKLPMQSRPYQSIAAGVVERRFIEDGSTEGRWRYVAESQPIDPPWGHYDPDGGGPQGPQDFYPTESWTHVSLLDVDETTHCTKHYFSSSSVDQERYWQGLPFSPTNTVGGDLYLSTEVYEDSDVDGFCFGDLLRSTAVEYERDAIPGDGTTYGEFHNPLSDANRRIASDQTTFHDDGGRWVRTDRSFYTGLGQYERSETTGWDSASRVETTDYLLANEPPLPTAPWILGLYDTQTVSEAGDTATTVSSFDPDTGFLECRRTLSGSSAQAVAASFTDDGLGNVAREEWALGSCYAPDYDYAIDHTYQSGVLESSQYEGVAFKSYDALIDASTGLAARTFATDGLATEYEYDELGRLESADPPGEDARVEYIYGVAQGNTPAQVNMSWKRTDGTVRKTRRLEFDGFGRVEKEGVSRPGGQLAFRAFGYNALGWQLSQSEWGMPNPSNHKTEFGEFDAFGRPGLVTAPDTKETNFVYLGVRRMERTSQVETTGGPQLAKYVEIKDAFGRLVRVEEPGSEGLEADYTYDVGNRLSEVALSGADGDQLRAFDYDHRGFLLSENHPEKDGTVVYDGHDARGHAASKTDGFVTLNFGYDAAERLRTIRDGGPGGPVVKEFTYDGAASRGAGKLYRGIRHNDLSGAPGSLGVGNDLVVTETYDYDGSDGRVKSRTTNLDFGGSSYAGTMSFWFNELGLPSQETYPDCPSCSSAPTPTVLYGYNDGHISVVRGKDFNGASYDFSRGIAYHPSGLMRWLVHGNSGGNVIDRQYINSANDMARPNRLYAYVNGSPGQPLWDSGTYGYDGSGNIRTIGSDSFFYDKTSRLTRAEFEGMSARPYGYDSFGNLTSLDGRPWPTSTATNRVTAFTYDARGNVQFSPDFGSLDYDAINMPVSRSTGGDEAWFAYTADDERVWTGRVDSGVASQKLSLRGLDGKVRRELSRKPGSKKGIAWVKDYFYRGGPLLATQAAGGEVRHYHLDHLGTPRAISDDTGAAVSLHKYWPYGEEITDPSASDNVMQFTGHERDEMGSPASNADDLDYMHARYYTPWAGRFLSVDPEGGSGKLKHPQSWNRYIYALGNPLRFLDPNGEESIEQTTLELFAALNLMAVEESLQDGTAAFFGIGLADGMAESLEELIRPGEEPPAGLLRGDPGGLPDELRDAYTAGVRTGDRLGNRIAATGSGVPVLILGQAKHTARHGVKAVKGLLSGDTEAFLKHGDKMFQPTPTITLITFIMTRPQVGHDDDDEDPEDE